MTVREAVERYEVLEGEIAGSDLSDADYLEVLESIIDHAQTAHDAKEEEMK